MPMYDYYCPGCNATISKFRPTEKRKDPVACKECDQVMDFVQFPQDSSKPEGRTDVKDVFRKV